MNIDEKDAAGNQLNQPGEAPVQRIIDLKATEVSKTQSGETVPDPDAAVSRDTQTTAGQAHEEAKVAGSMDEESAEEDDAARMQIESSSPSLSGSAIPAAERPPETKEAVSRAEIAAPKTAAPKTAAPKTAARTRSGIAGFLLASVVGSGLSIAGLGALNSSGLLEQIPGLSGLFGSDGEKAGGSPALAALDAKIAALEAASKTPQSVDQSPAFPQMEALDARLAQLEQDNANLKAALAAASSTGAADPALAGQIAALSERIAGAEQSITALNNLPAGSFASQPLPAGALQSISGLEQGLAGFEQKVEALTGRVAGNEERLATLADAQVKAIKGEKLAAALRAFNGLEAAIVEGKPFAGLLEPIGALNGSQASLAALTPLAKSGVPTGQMLLAQFDGLAEIMLAGPKLESQGVLETLIENAGKLVSVRPEGPLEGTTPQAIASRVRAALQDGDFAGAMAQWKVLPEAAMPQAAGSAAADFAKNLQARIDAASAMETLAGLTSATAANQ